MRIVGLIGFFIVMAWVDLPQLLRHQKKKELIVYAAVLGLAFLLSLLHILDFKLWSINGIITDLVRGIGL